MGKKRIKNIWEIYEMLMTDHRTVITYIIIRNKAKNEGINNRRGGNSACSVCGYFDRT